MDLLWEQAFDFRLWFAGGVDLGDMSWLRVYLKREFKLPWREAGPPNHLDDKADSDQEVVNKELSLSLP